MCTIIQFDSEISKSCKSRIFFFFFFEVSFGKVLSLLCNIVYEKQTVKFFFTLFSTSKAYLLQPFMATILTYYPILFPSDTSLFFRSTDRSSTVLLGQIQKTNTVKGYIYFFFNLLWLPFEPPPAILSFFLGGMKC